MTSSGRSTAISRAIGARSNGSESSTSTRSSQNSPRCCRVHREPQHRLGVAVHLRAADDGRGTPSARARVAGSSPSGRRTETRTIGRAPRFGVRRSGSIEERRLADERARRLEARPRPSRRATPSTAHHAAPPAIAMTRRRPHQRRGPAPCGGEERGEHGDARSRSGGAPRCPCQRSRNSVGHRARSAAPRAGSRRRSGRGCGRRSSAPAGGEHRLGEQLHVVGKDVVASVEQGPRARGVADLLDGARARAHRRAPG